MKEVTIFNADATEVYPKEEVKEQIAENLGIPKEEVTEEQVWEEYNFLSNTDYEDERTNLHKVLDGRILCIADLGLWNGRRTGYKVLGYNLRDILSQAQGDYYKVYADRYTVRAIDPHHDGTNYYEFRELREDRNYDKLLSKLYNNEEVTRQEINYYTKSLRPYIKEVYGI